MKKIFDAVIGLSGVKGAVILDEEGGSVYDPLRMNTIEAELTEDSGAGEDWQRLIFSDGFNGELDLIFDKGRLYIRRIGEVYLLVLMDPAASVSSLKLTCDLMVQESVGKKAARKKLFGLF